MINPKISVDWSTTKPIVPFSCTPRVQEVHTKFEVVHPTSGQLGLGVIFNTHAFKVMCLHCAHVVFMYVQCRCSIFSSEPKITGGHWPFSSKMADQNINIQINIQVVIKTHWLLLGLGHERLPLLGSKFTCPVNSFYRHTYYQWWQQIGGKGGNCPP